MNARVEKSHMLTIAGVGHNHAPLQRQDAHPLLRLEPIIMPELIGQRGRDILGWLIQALVAFLGMPGFACNSVLFDFGPQGFIGGSYLAGDGTSPFGRDLEPSTPLNTDTPFHAHLLPLLALP